MRRKGWLMDFVCRAYLHFRGQNHHGDILPGTGGDPRQQQASGGAKACMETLQSRTHPVAFEAMLMGYFASSKVITSYLAN